MARHDQFCIVRIRITEEHGEDAEELLLAPFIEELQAAVAEAEAGELDDEEFDGRWHRLTFVGPDADELEEVLEGVIAGSAFESDARIAKRYGAADDPEADELELET